MKSRFIGIAGPSGSGKTTLTAKLASHYGSDNCVVVSADNYYKTTHPLPLEKINYDEPASIEFSLLLTHLTLLKQGQTIDSPVFDFENTCRTNRTIRIVPKPMIFVEGILIFCIPELLSLFDLKIFIKSDLDFCLLRRIERDVISRGKCEKETLQQYKDSVGPMRRKYVTPSKKVADLVVTNNTETNEFDISQVIKFIDCVSPTLAQGFFKRTKIPLTELTPSLRLT